MAESLFGTERRDQFAFGIEPHAVFFQIFCRCLATQIGDAERRAVAVILWIASRFNKFFDDHVGGRIGRVAHAHVNHIVAGTPFLQRQRVDAGKQIAGQPLYAFGDFDLKRFTIVGRFVGGAKLIIHGRRAQGTGGKRTLL